MVNPTLATYRETLLSAEPYLKELAPLLLSLRNNYMDAGFSAAEAHSFLEIHLKQLVRKD